MRVGRDETQAGAPSLAGVRAGLDRTIGGLTPEGEKRVVTWVVSRSTGSEVRSMFVLTAPLPWRALPRCRW